VTQAEDIPFAEGVTLPPPLTAEEERLLREPGPDFGAEFDEPEPDFTGTEPGRDDDARLIDGASFIFDEPPGVPAVWGKDQAVAWVKGEGLLLVGPDGVGKTTLMQQLILARVGVQTDLLGMEVEPAEGPILYIAADRPRQAARSFARMVTEEDARELERRLIVWKGPLPFDLTKSPQRLAEFVRSCGAGTVFVDSLKDVALDLSKDEVGSRVNLAVQEVIAADIELCAGHHQRKETASGGKPRHLADVYGSRWLTAGMGSVVLLWGEPGDLVVEFVHLKQPAEEVGPLTVVHDHAHGHSSVQEGVDLEHLLWNTAAAGLTAPDAAGLLFATMTPTANQIQKARRRLNRLVDNGVARRDDAQAPDPVRYFPHEVGA
jgi:replicative DNA helicase